MVNIKLFFYGLILLWFDNTNDVMQNSMYKFRQNYCFRETRFLSEKLKTLTSSSCHRFQYFLLKLRTRFLLTNVCKRLSGIFFILSSWSWVICKNKKDLVSTHSFFRILINNSRSKQKENAEQPFVDIFKQERVQNFSKNY